MTDFLLSYLFTYLETLAILSLPVLSDAFLLCNLQLLLSHIILKRYFHPIKEILCCMLCLACLPVPALRQPQRHILPIPEQQTLSHLRVFPLGADRKNI